jgi:hypothetical protein
MLALEDSELQYTLQLLEPGTAIEEAIINLLLEKARRNYFKYQMIDRQLRRKYKMSFDGFSRSKLMEEPSFEIEQDFFDWDMAITGISDMKTEIEKLLQSKP